MENQDLMNETNQSAQAVLTRDEVKGFFKNNLPQILKRYFTEPVTGTYNLFLNADGKAYQHSLILIITTGLLYIIVPYLLLGDMRSYVPFSQIMWVGIGASLYLLVISALSFGIKSITGKPDFKRELLTGGMCGIPVSAMLLVMILAKIFIGSDPMNFMTDYASMLDNLKLLFLFVLYIFLLLINTMFQSLRASGTKETLAWYASPIAIGLAGYITAKIVAAFV